MYGFYQSKKWRKLLTIIKLERVNDKGQLICEYCGKPIVRAYDCIGHHVIPLTDENINDATVALNPDNIQLVHHICHNHIHNKLGFQERQVYLVYGPPFAGKRKFVDGARNDGDLIVDIDSIWQSISGCPRGLKPGRLRANVFGIRDALIDMVKYRRGKWLNAYVIGGYPLSGERERIMKELQAREIYVESNEDDCLIKCGSADEKKFVRDWFEKFGKTSPPL